MKTMRSIFRYRNKSTSKFRNLEGIPEFHYQIDLDLSKVMNYSLSYYSANKAWLCSKAYLHIKRCFFSAISDRELGGLIRQVFSARHVICVLYLLQGNIRRNSIHLIIYY